MGHREKHYIDGVEAPSVTTVLNVIRKPFLEQWRGRLGNKECDRIMKESQEIGQRVHKAFESFFRADEMPALTANEARMVDELKRWAAEAKFNPIELETHVESHVHTYHGTFDAVGHFGDGKLVILDWKSSSGIDDSYAAQLAAYAQAYKEGTGTIITEGVVVRVDKKEDAKKTLEVRRFTDLPRYFTVFLNCLELWKFVNKKGHWATK